MGHQEQQGPAGTPEVAKVAPQVVPQVVPRIVPRAVPRVARADGLEGAVRKAGPVIGQAGLGGWAAKGDGEPPKEADKAGPPKGEDPPKDPPKDKEPPKDPPKDPKLGRLGRLDRLSRALADTDLAVSGKGPQGLAEGALSRPDRLGRP
ncbi:hypothetical protein LL946_00935 [Knoellia locipacati]|uniref:hypothetical protein n=1 Tax=Knoellia locipacati TaxID=882824 RepID=UPI003850F04C